ncbi:MAG TPA: tyrosine--tRNA ligase [Thermoanaerobaculia bacterium]|nr:tyrosine--tRNA ligase [Thermoanaerobaculia bacterium]
MNVFDEFEWRGLVYDATPGLRELLDREKLTAYIGFDPTAASLHVGSLLPILGLARLQRFGHSPIAIAGGGTGMIGDPSGKTQERQLLSKEKIEENLQGIKAQLVRFLDFEAKENPARVVNNADWLAVIPMVDFLRDVGKHFTVNAMLAKESVKRRLESEDGISFTELSYMLLQAYDFLVLYDRYGCRLQMGGSDQWGNILAGADLIRRLRGEGTSELGGQKKLAHGLVFPLVTTSSGVKFGKTEAGAVWLDPALTSPFRFYQFWINTDDRDVVHYLKSFTWLSQQEIAELEEKVRAAPQEREAQKRLAREVTGMVHGEDALAKAERATAVLFGAEVSALEPREVSDVFADVPSTEIPKARLQEGLPLVDLLVTAGLTPSKGEARRAIQGGGIYLNNLRMAEEKRAVTTEDTIGGELIVLRKGRKEYRLVRVAG